MYVSSCNTRNEETNCHNSKAGQYFIPHDCGKISAKGQRKIVVVKSYSKFLSKVDVYMGQNVCPSDGHENNFRKEYNALPFLKKKKKKSLANLQRLPVVVIVSTVPLTIYDF